eukprot:SAG11_NODE_647_length_7957_cov_2.900903_10_plen_202_part_00
MPLLGSLLVAMAAPAAAERFSCGLGAGVAPAATNRSVTWCGARFTVLTPHAIRLEWSANSPPTFDDLPSTLILDRAPGAAPAFSHALRRGHDSNLFMLELNTSALSVQFSAGGFTARTLSVTLLESGTVWRPGADASGNLNGSLNTMDCCELHSDSPPEPKVASLTPPLGRARARGGCVRPQIRTGRLASSSISSRCSRAC